MTGYFISKKERSNVQIYLLYNQQNIQIWQNVATYILSCCSYLNRGDSRDCPTGGNCAGSSHPPLGCLPILKISRTIKRADN